PPPLPLFFSLTSTLIGNTHTHTHARTDTLTHTHTHTHAHTDICTPSHIHTYVHRRTCPLPRLASHISCGSHRLQLASETLKTNYLPFTPSRSCHPLPPPHT